MKLNLHRGKLKYRRLSRQTSLHKKQKRAAGIKKAKSFKKKTELKVNHQISSALRLHKGWDKVRKKAFSETFKKRDYSGPKKEIEIKGELGLESDFL